MRASRVERWIALVVYLLLLLIVLIVLLALPVLVGRL